MNLDLRFFCCILTHVLAYSLILPTFTELQMPSVILGLQFCKSLDFATFVSTWTKNEQLVSKSQTRDTVVGSLRGLQRLKRVRVYARACFLSTEKKPHVSTTSSGLVCPTTSHHACFITQHHMTLSYRPPQHHVPFYRPEARRHGRFSQTTSHHACFITQHHVAPSYRPPQHHVPFYHPSQQHVPFYRPEPRHHDLSETYLCRSSHSTTLPKVPSPSVRFTLSIVDKIKKRNTNISV